MLLLGIFGKRVKHHPIQLPAFEMPVMPKPYTQRVLKVASRRTFTYCLMAANAILIPSGVLIAFLYAQKLSVTPYVTDGSSYGCSPVQVEGSIPAGVDLTPDRNIPTTVRPIEQMNQIEVE